MTEKRLGPEGARFKKGSWAPTNEGSGAAKRTYLDEREALEARNAELETKAAELEASLADPSLGRLYRDVGLASWIFDELEGPFIFDGLHGAGHGPIDAMDVCITEDPFHLLRLERGIYQAFNQTKGLKGDDAIKMAKGISLDIADAERRAAYTSQPPISADKSAHIYCIRHSSGVLYQLSESKDCEFLIEPGAEIGKTTVIYRFPLTLEHHNNVAGARADQEMVARRLFASFIERSTTANKLYERVHTLKGDRRIFAWVAAAGWLAAALIWYF